MYRRQISDISIAIAALFMVLFLSTSLTTRLNAQTLNFNLTPNQDRTIQIGGEGGQKGGVGAAVWNNRTYVAYTDNSGDGDLWLTYTDNGTNYASPTLVGHAGSNSNPSLTVFNNQLYIAYIDINGIPRYFTTSDGTTFSYEMGFGGNPAGANSPSITVYNGFLYYAYRAVTCSCLEIVRLDSFGRFFLSTYTNIPVGISPGLGVFNNTLYVAYRDNGGDHYIYLATSTNGIDFTLSSAAAKDHTSTAVSLVVHNNILYLIYRQNDTGNRLYYAYSTDGINFSGNNAVSITMGGNPASVSANFACCAPMSTALYVIYRQNDSGHYLYDTYAP